MTAFSDLINDPKSSKRWAVILEPYDPNLSSPGTTTIYLSDGNFTSAPGDTPSNQSFQARIVDGISIQRNLVNVDGRLGGRSTPQYGGIRVAAKGPDGQTLTDWWSYGWDGRSVEVYLGGPDFDFGDFGLVFKGIISGISKSGNEIIISVEDWQGKFTKQVQQNQYAGSGGKEGGTDLVDKWKPKLYGLQHGIQPVLVDYSKQIYQVSDGVISSVLNVFDKAAALTFGTDRADYSAMSGTAPASGSYDTCLAEGFIRLGTTPAGLLTVSSRGDASGGYVSTVSDIISRIATSAGGLSSGDLDSTSFSDLNTANSCEVGYWCGIEPAPIEQVFDLLSDSIGSTWGGNRAGKLSVRRLEEPSVSPDASFGVRQIITLSRLTSATPPFRIDLKYGHNLSVHGTQDIVSSATAANAEFYKQEWRTVSSSEDADVQAMHLKSEPLEIETRIMSQSDASTEATRLLSLYGAERVRVQCTVKAPAFSLDLGDTVEITWPDDGLENGRSFVIIGLTERAEICEIDLLLWG